MRKKRVAGKKKGWERSEVSLCNQKTIGCQKTPVQEAVDGEGNIGVISKLRALKVGQASAIRESGPKGIILKKVQVQNWFCDRPLPGKESNTTEEGKEKLEPGAQA